MQWIGEHHFTDLASNIQNNWNPGDKDPARYYVTNTGTKRRLCPWPKSLDYGWTKSRENSAQCPHRFRSEQSKRFGLEGERCGYYYYKIHLDDKDEQSATLAFVVLNLILMRITSIQAREFTMNVKFEAIRSRTVAAAEQGWPVGELETP
jgi:hypothetical protein